MALPPQPVDTYSFGGKKNFLCFYSYKITYDLLVCPMQPSF